MTTITDQHSSWLIIDDDVVFCRILKKSLDRLGFSVYRQ
jgi:ActR/RegA family two-component response regulator